MKKRFSLLCLTMIFGLFASAQSPLGKWKTIDDVTGKARSIVEIYESGGKLYGRVTKLFREPGEDLDPICDKCSGYKHNQKVIGMNVISGLTKSGNEWGGGEIVDPKNGKVYSCYISMESADKLKVRGYIGLSVVGRTQYWYREK